jgi:predicted nucleotidyltransferase
VSVAPAPSLPKLVRRTIERLVRAFRPERIVLFGSYAKGTNHLASDVDLLVVADLDGDPAVHQRRARQLSADCFPRVDVVIVSEEEFLRASETTAPFLRSVVEYGATVYSRE